MVIMFGQIIHIRIARPVTQLQKELKTLHNHGLHTRLSGEYFGEIRDISASINEMLSNMYDLTNQIVHAQQITYEMELREEQAMLYALQMQVNPHFLFNTLQTLAGVAAAHNNPEIVSICLLLSKILRYALSKEPFGEADRLTTVQDEIDIAREYLKIIALRFTGAFRWDVQAGEDVLHCTCLKMLLQPLFENSVKHGLENIYRDGCIIIKAYRDGQFIRIEIHDNGAGMTPEKVEELLIRQ